jgi:hypothetical protein
MSARPSGSTRRSAPNRSATGGAWSAKERSYGLGDGCPPVVRDGRVGELLAMDQVRTEERPRVVVPGCAEVHGRRDRERQHRCELRQHGHLADDAGNRDLATGEAERPLPVHEPDGVVPALGKRAERAHHQVREPRCQEPADERRIHDKLGRPLLHRCLP